MGSRFRNELTAVPPVTIGITRRGLTTTIGWDSARSRGSGVAPDRRALQHVGNYALSGPLPTDRYLIPGTRQEFGGGRLADMTSPGLSSFKELLNAARQREAEIKADIRKARRELAIAWLGNAAGWATLASVLLPPVRRSASTALTTRRSDVATLNDNLRETKISVDFNMETEVAAPHLRMQMALDGLSTASHAWTVRTEQQIDRVKARSFAGVVVARVKTLLRRQEHDLVATSDTPYAVSVQGGKFTAYFYPGFVLVAGGPMNDFALIDMLEFEVLSETIGFTETESVPRDARQVGTTWAKANKNGSRDKRFAHNRELPIMAYGGLHLTGPGDFNEKLMFSRVEICNELVAAVGELKRVLASGKQATRIPKQRVIDSPRAS